MQKKDIELAPKVLSNVTCLICIDMLVSILSLLETLRVLDICETLIIFVSQPSTKVAFFSPQADLFVGQHVPLDHGLSIRCSSNVFLACDGAGFRWPSNWRYCRSIRQPGRCLVDLRSKSRLTSSKDDDT